MLLRARQVLAVGAQLVIQETNSYGCTRRAPRGEEGKETSLADAIAETTPGNFVRKKTGNPNHEAKRVTHGNEPQNLP